MRIYKFLLIIALATSICKIAFAQDTDNFKAEIYSKLRDRRCSTMSLDKCDCPDAREMKAYIEALLETGVSKEDIFYKVARKFSLNTILDEKIKADVEQRFIKEAGTKHPQIILESRAFNFGEVNRKQGKISKVFKLSNEGSAPLIIKNIKTSCPCTSVALVVNRKKSVYFSTQGAPNNWQSEIKSGKSAELEVVLDLASPHVKPGSIIRDATIITNDPVYPELSISIEAELIN